MTDTRNISELANDIQTLREKVQAKVVSFQNQKTLDLRSFKKWLRENKDTVVGWVGYQARVTPLLQYCTANNVSLTSKVKSRWGAKYDEYCQQYEGVPGRYTGDEALTLLCQVIGYQHYLN